ARRVPDAIHLPSRPGQRYSQRPVGRLTSRGNVSAPQARGYRMSFAPTSSLDNPAPADDCAFPVSALFFKRFLKRPFQIASIVPSSKALVERVASKMDFSHPRVIAES